MSNFGSVDSYKLLLRRALTIYALYVCGCILLELGERHAFHVAPLSEVRAIADANARRTAEEVRAKRLEAMTESPLYLLYLGGTLMASIGVFIGGLFVMKKPLEPLTKNPAAAHFIYIPLLFFPAIACLAMMAPPWVIPFLADGRGVGEMIEAFRNLR